MPLASRLRLWPDSRQLRLPDLIRGIASWSTGRNIGSNKLPHDPAAARRQDKRGRQVVFFIVPGVQVITQAQVQGELPARFPVVLHIGPAREGKPGECL